MTDLGEQIEIAQHGLAFHVHGKTSRIRCRLKQLGKMQRDVVITRSHRNLIGEITVAFGVEKLGVIRSHDHVGSGVNGAIGEMHIRLVINIIEIFTSLAAHIDGGDHVCTI